MTPTAMTRRPSPAPFSALFPAPFTLLRLTLALCFAASLGHAAAQGLPPSGDGVGSASAAGAPPAAPVDADARPLHLELTGGMQSLSNGYGHWREAGVRGSYTTGRHVIQGELTTSRRFNDSGTYAGIGDTYTFNEDWYGALSVGVGHSAFYLPKYRIDGTLNRKWLADRNLVTSIGAGYYDAPDGHTDRSVTLGAAYYFQSPWIVEGGVRLNRSNPGKVRTHQQFVAATYGRPGNDVVTGRYAWGGEGYLAVGPSTQLVDFDSEEASLAWRHWLSADTGLLFSVNRYRNPLYTRSGATVGVFRDF